MLSGARGAARLEATKKGESQHKAISSSLARLELVLLYPLVARDLGIVAAVVSNHPEVRSLLPGSIQ